MKAGTQTIEITPDLLRDTAAKFLFAIQEAGKIYRRIEDVKGEGTFIREVSMDETDSPQTPAELLIILAAIADASIPIQTIAPKFSGRFNKGVDYVGDPAQLASELALDAAAIEHAIGVYELPANLKLSIHSGNDKFSIYPAFHAAIQRFSVGIHLKTAGTTWLEEVIGLTEAGGDGLALAKEIYAQAFAHSVELCAPYATVIDIDPSKLPPPSEVAGWSSEQFAGAPRRIFGQWICNGSTSTACTGGTQMYGFAVGWTGILAGWDCDTVQDQCASNGYDGFNRLTSRSIYTGTTQNYTYGYDRYGNRWNETPLNGGYTSSLSFHAATNKIITAGFAYDAAGNLTNDTFHTYTYDAEGNVTAVDGGSTAKYVYNALNQRVQTVVGSVNTESVFNLAGQRVSVWNGTTGAQIEGKYYWGAKPVAYYEAWGAVSFEHQNWQGTERMRTTYNGGVEGTYTSQPFGDGLTTTSGSDTDAYHYAMVDHDYQSDTEHAQFRQYSNAQGRWMAPDPYYGSYDFSNPQSMNRYAYALNSPLSNIDPSGLYCRWDEGPDDDDPTDGGATYDDCIAQGGSWMDTTSVTVYGGASNDPGITMENGQQIYPTIAGAPNNENYSFAKQWLKDVKSCFVDTGLGTIANQMDPFSPSASNAVQGAVDSASQSALAGAAAYSVGRGLTVPLRSGVVRAGVGASEVLGEASGWLTIANLYYGIAKAYKAEWQQCGW
jgi:RHS repeat-associated protein